MHTFTAGGRSITEFSEIKHEVNLRLNYYHSYGETVPAAAVAPGETPPGALHAVKVMGVYYYRINRQFDLLGGAGVLPVFGDGVKPFWRGLVSGGIVYSPGGIFFMRGELSYLTGRLDGSDWGVRSFALQPQANASFALGFDLRRKP